MRYPKLIASLGILLLFIVFLIVLYQTQGQKSEPNEPIVVEPKYVYLTWQGNTSTTMTVNYHTDDTTNTSVVYYGKQSVSEHEGWYTQKKEGGSFRTDSVNHRWVHIVELTDLEPGATYYFVAGDSIQGLSKERKFRTIPTNITKLKFVVGGDMGFETVVDTLMQSAAQKNPDFVFIGGDISYADGNINNLHIWDVWFNRWECYMITNEGYTPPLVTCIGNHEVNGSFASSPTAAPFYFKFFTQNEIHPYGHKSFGKLISLYFLDTYQVTDLADRRQINWLDSTMKANSQLNYAAQMAMYHVPLYPSYSALDNDLSTFLRENWMPIFDQYNLDLAFENHDHTLKCTHPMKHGNIDPEGTVYIGDGAWGRGPRDTIATNRDYLRYADNTLHYWTCEIDVSALKMNAYGVNGENLYEFDIRLDN